MSLSFIHITRTQELQTLMENPFQICQQLFDRIGTILFFITDAIKIVGAYYICKTLKLIFGDYLANNLVIFRDNLLCTYIILYMFVFLQL